MKLMKNLRFVRDLRKRYIPGSLIVVLLVVIAFAVSTMFSLHYIGMAMDTHAHQAADRAYIQVDAAMHNGFDMLDSLKKQTMHGTLSNRTMKNITRMFRRTLEDKYDIMEYAEGQYVIYGDGKLRLGIDVSDTEILIGEIDQKKLCTAMESAYNESYGYALFDRKTGIALINMSGFEYNNYFDCVRGLGDRKAASELLKNDHAVVTFHGLNGDKLFLAQRVENNCVLMLVLRPSMLASARGGDFAALLPGLCGMLILLVALIWVVVMSIRYTEQFRKNAVARIIGWREMAETVAYRGNFAMFELEMKGEDADELTYFFNSLPLPDDDVREHPVYSVSQLEKLLNVDTADIGKLSQAVAALKDGDVAETEVNCVRSTGIQCLRFEMQRDSQNLGRVIGCIYDCTDDERLRRTEVSESEFIESMRPRSEVIWHINVTRNKWKVLFTQHESIRSFFKDGGNVRRSYDEDIDNLMKRFIHPDEYDTYVENFTCEALKRAYNEGKTEYSMDFRVRYRETPEWRWVRFVVREWCDPNNRDIKVNVFTVNVNQKKRAELERLERADILHRSLTAINGMFFGLFYVDIVTGMCYAAKPYRGETGTRFAAPFKELFGSYVEESVHPEDRTAVNTVLDLWYIRKTMVKNTHLLQLNYRSKLGDTYYWSTVSVQAAQFENGTVTRVVIALQHTHGADTSRHEANM